MDNHKVGDLLLGFNANYQPILGQITKIDLGGYNRYIVDWSNGNRTFPWETDINMFKKNLEVYLAKSSNR